MHIRMTHTCCTAVEYYLNRHRILVVWQVVKRMAGMVDTVPTVVAAGMVDWIQMLAVVGTVCIVVPLFRMDYTGKMVHNSNQMLAVQMMVVQNWQVHRIDLEIDLDSVE